MPTFSFPVGWNLYRIRETDADGVSLCQYAKREDTFLVLHELADGDLVVLPNAPGVEGAVAAGLLVPVYPVKTIEVPNERPPAPWPVAPAPPPLGEDPGDGRRGE